MTTTTPPERPTERSARAGAAITDTSNIRVSYGPQNELVAAADELRFAALGIRAKRAATGMRIPMPAIRTIADMGVGKTWGAEKLEAKIAARPDTVPGTRPVLIATLDTSGSQKSVPQAILRALKVKRWDYGSPATLWKRALDELHRHDVQLIFFDEINRAARRPTMSPAIGGDLFDLLLLGQAAIAFLGTKEAQQLFNRAPALGDRLRAPVMMKPLDWFIDEDRATLVDFLAKMDRAYVEHGLLAATSGLDDERVASTLWEVCRGRLRPLCLLLETAITNVRRAGGDRLGWDDLAQAVEEHSIPNEVIGHNPFRGEIAQ